MSFENEITKLNPDQRKAVETLDGPVLVIAGPGTGKTQVLTLRIANILNKTDAYPSNILCLTFTDAGAVTMRKRLFKMIGSDAHKVKITTFHSFCGDIIQFFPEKFAFTRELNQMGDLDRSKIIQTIIDSVPESGIEGFSHNHLKPFFNKYFYKIDILNSIKNLKREGIDVEKFKVLSRKHYEGMIADPKLNKLGKPTLAWKAELKVAEKNLELAEYYKYYQDELTNRGLYDYEDMIFFVMKKFEDDDELLQYYQERYLYILVDEYQDTNGSQNEILRLLGSFDRRPNIFVVGDDDQAIYRFQGANVQNLNNFVSMWQDVKIITIDTNYRSTQTILDAANSVIENNNERLTKVIEGMNKKLHSYDSKNIGREIEVYNLNNDEAEDQFLIEKIQSLIAMDNDPSEIAIIYRNHGHAEVLIDKFLKNNIPIKLFIGSNVLNDKVVQQLIDLLKIINFDIRESLDNLLFRVLNYEFLGFSEVDTFKLVRYFNTKNYGYKKTFLNLFDLLLEKTHLIEAGVKEVDKFYEFGEKILKWKKNENNLSLYEFIQNVAEESGYISYIFYEESLKENSNGEPQMQLIPVEQKSNEKIINIDDKNAVNSFFLYIRQLNKSNKDIDLKIFLNDLNLFKEDRIAIPRREVDTEKKGVNFMTAHSSKGREFEHVFIIRCSEKHWAGKGAPDKLRLIREVYGTEEISDDDSGIEEERRLFFVAMTRARKHLYLTLASKYETGGQEKEYNKAIFLEEINNKLIEYQDTSRYVKTNTETMLSGIVNKVQRNIEEEEREYLKAIISKLKLSASSLNEYIECPRKFKYNRLIKVPDVRNRAIVLGTVIHFTLEHFFKNLKAGERKDLNYLKFLFQKTLEKELLSEDDYKDILQEGIKILEKYFQTYSEKLIVPLEIEYTFGTRASNVVLNLKNGEPVILSGKLDKLEPLGNEVDSETNKIPVKVVDYKTSKPQSEKEILGLNKSAEKKYFRQLMFYKLLGELDEGFRKDMVSPKYDIQKVELDYLKPDTKDELRKVTIDVGKEELDELTILIEDVVTRIRNLEFEGTEEYPLCGECEWCEGKDKS